MESLEKKVKAEIKIAALNIKGSYLNEESMAEGKNVSGGCSGSGHPGDASSEYFESMLSRKVDKQDFNAFLNSKTSKKDTQMIYD